MEEKPSANSLGRFWWLWIACVVLSVQIGVLLQFGGGFIRWGIYALISMALLFFGAFLYRKAIKDDSENNISPSPFRNIFFPWPRSAVWLAVFVLAEFLIVIPLFAYSFSPCSRLDAIRKIDGCIAHIPHQSLVINTTFSSNGRVFATSEFQGDVRVWSYPDLALINDLGDGWSWGTKFSLSSNGDMIAICSYSGVTSIVETWTGRTLYTLDVKNDDGCNVVFAPDDHSVYVVSESGIQIWDVSTGKTSPSIVPENPDYFELSIDGSMFATGNLSGLINIHRSSDGKLLAVIEQPYLQAFAFSYDGKYLFAVGLDAESLAGDSKLDASTVKVWNIETGEAERTFNVQGMRAKHISSSRNSYVFIVGDDSCYRRNGSLFEIPCAYLWKSMDEQTPIGLQMPYGVQSLTFSPNEELILIGSYENVYIWKTP